LLSAKAASTYLGLVKESKDTHWHRGAYCEHVLDSGDGGHTCQFFEMLRPRSDREQELCTRTAREQRVEDEKHAGARAEAARLLCHCRHCRKALGLEWPVPLCTSGLCSHECSPLAAPLLLTGPAPGEVEEEVGAD
jgi:hypothetical protein